MKRVLLHLAVSATAVFLLSSCEPDISTVNWMYDTGWEARLEGAEVFNNPDSPISITEGWVGFIIHKRTGYFYAHNYTFGEGNFNFSMARGEHEQSIVYEYPTIKLPYVYKFSDGNSEMRYNIGTLSDDNNSIFFKEFNYPTVPEEGEFHLTFCNLTFKRSYKSLAK